MAFIKNNTNKVGSRVKIVDIDPIRGYAIEDNHGNRLIEIGWIISMADIDGDKFVCRQCGNNKCKHYDWYAKKCVQYDH